MNGIHDLGGMHGFGPVVAEANEPVFHAEWERRVFALTMASLPWRLGNIRDAWEHMPPVEYLATSYYEHWLFALQVRLERSDLVQSDELRRAREAPHTVPPPTDATHVREGALRRKDVRALRPSRRVQPEVHVAPRFAVGQSVMTRNIQPVGHTRLPRYARGRRGVIERDQGVFSFPDAATTGEESGPQHVYSVSFRARELWGPAAAEADRIFLDLWDNYLVAA